MSRRVTVVGLVVAGLVVALALAFFLSPRASSSPDGLERVAEDQGFVDTADDHALADGPFADYATTGIDDEGLSTGVAGVIGVVVTFAVGSALFFGIRALHRRQATPAGSADATVA